MSTPSAQIESQTDRLKWQRRLLFTLFANVPKKLYGQAINLIIHTCKISSILKFCITVTPYLTFFFK